MATSWKISYNMVKDEGEPQILIIDLLLSMNKVSIELT